MTEQTHRKMLFLFAVIIAITCFTANAATVTWDGVDDGIDWDTDTVKTIY